MHMTSYDFDTPMMQQYLKIKEEYPDCLIFFRLGDFYEMFLEDAKVGAQVLDITLTSRSRGRDGRIPMAGVPYHAVESYLSKLIKSGYKVAICEQVSEPDGKNLVTREVVRIVTPGTVLDESNLERKENNYIVTLQLVGNYLAFAACDLSTGEFQTTQIETDKMENTLLNEIARFNPSECVLPNSLYNDAHLLKLLNSQRNLNIYPFSDWEIFADGGGTHLKRHFNLSSLESFYLEGKELSQAVASALLGYLKKTQFDKISHIKKINFYDSEGGVTLDRSTITNLELFKTIRDGGKKGTLINVLDETVTPMGGRLLRRWVLKPLIDTDEINLRLDTVEELLKKRPLRIQIRELLKEISDIERVLARLSAGLANARDLILLRNSLRKSLELHVYLEELKSPYILNAKAKSDELVSSLVDLIATHIVEDPPFSIKEGGLIKDGIDTDLDSLKSRVSKSKNWIVDLESIERKRTGINSLKVKFNKVFGYYIEISKSNLNSVPDDYIRKQTLVNGERYITPALKEHEEIILMTEEQTNDIEKKIYLKVVEQVIELSQEIQNVANLIAQVDVLSNFSHLAEKYKYVRPVFSGEKIKIKDGRHPVVERLLDEIEFVPNDTLLDHEENQLLILTGPNMAGKSVYLRQVALIVLMSQIGSFVSAREAQISTVDKIFVRSGASDVIASGLSTFMVEMVETAYILNNATQKSLIVMDEIGRGTSTYDGISIAWSVAEFLVTHTKAKSLFATHYHELQLLADEFSQIKNYQVSVKEENGNLVFLHKVIEGGASHSHGVKVADIAGIPKSVTKNAFGILNKLEKRSQTNKNVDTVDTKDSLREKVQEVDLDNLTPLEAMRVLEELKRLI